VRRGKGVEVIKENEGRGVKEQAAMGSGRMRRKMRRMMREKGNRGRKRRKRKTRRMRRMMKLWMFEM